MFNKNPFEVSNNNELAPTLEEVVESLSRDQGKMGGYLRVALDESDRNMQPSMMIKRVIQLACAEVGLDAGGIESDLEEGRRDYASILMKNYLSEFRKNKEERDLQDMGVVVEVEPVKEMDVVAKVKSGKSIVTEQMKKEARMIELREKRRTGSDDPAQILS